jgi:serine/threonine protein phosphatase PrpC
MRLEMSCLSDVGLVRTRNEDCLSCDTAAGLAVLADGMGGYRAGEVASEIAVQTVIHELATLDFGQANQMHDRLRLEQTIIKANQEIFQAATEQLKYHGMGTTIVVAWFRQEAIFIGHVGDSRLYRLRNREFQALTKDHSVLQDLIDCGYYTKEQAKNSPHRNLVTRALGVGKNVNVDVQEKTVCNEDIYLLCSDGLHDKLDDGEIKAIIEKYRCDIDLAAQALVAAANNNGGEDNISVILIRILPQELPASRPWWQKLINFKR